HRELEAAWRRARPGAERAIAAALAAPAARCTGGAPGDPCTVRVPLGLPELVLEIDRPPGGEARARCSVAPSEAHLRLLRLPSGRPYRGARVRLVSRAMGAAARDAGELVSGGAVIRLRPGGGAIALPRDPAGLVAAGRVDLGGGAAVSAGERGARLELDAAASGAAAGVRLLAREPSGAWRRVPIG